MPLVILDTIEEQRGCRQINFWDITGAFDATTNPTGYGDATTVVTSTITKAVINVYPQGYTVPIVFTFTIVSLVITGCTITYVDGTTAPLTLTYNVFPFTQTAPFIFIGDNLGNGVSSEINFGAYHIEYYVYVGATMVGNTANDFLITCQVDRAVKNAAGALETTDCDCTTSRDLDVFKSEVILDSAKWCMENGEPIKAGQSLAYAFNLANNDCQSCK